MRNFTEIEKKWQNYWQEHHCFKAVTGDKSKTPYYILVEFPYPSGAGLHVGHVRSYTAQDVLARVKRMQGYNVLFPMGWDAFGAPAEQYAIKNHIHPKDAVKENIHTFKGQMQSLGFSFDWDREFSTTDPEYYKWTQWQFLQFYKHGMAYKAKKDVNWCPTCKSVLSNEDSAGGVCERCGSKVVQKEKEQWMLRMSDYAEDLLKGLDDTHFADRVKLGQINWIGKSTGAEVDFTVQETGDKLTVYTTRCDTLFGATYCVLAPEHILVDKITLVHFTGTKKPWKKYTCLWGGEYKERGSYEWKYQFYKKWRDYAHLSPWKNCGFELPKKAEEWRYLMKMYYFPQKKYIKGIFAYLKYLKMKTFN